MHYNMYVCIFMNTQVNSDADLERFLRTAAVVSRDYPVVTRGNHLSKSKSN